MITDFETTSLYLADTLKKMHPSFYAQLLTKLLALGIVPSLLQGTKAVWAVDYMPIQVSRDKFVQFVYNPDYLRQYAKWLKTISDVTPICKVLGLNPEKSDILLDGGNVVRSTNKIIMCDKIFKENPHYTERELIATLEKLFEVDQIVFIPTDPTDIIGHADGTARFLDDTTVLINKYSDKDEEYGLRLKLSLHNANLNYIEVPYNPYGNQTELEANGIYVNYLQMQQGVLVPTFGIKEDDVAIRQFENLFSGQTVIPLNSNDIAKDGGILNCISWNIFAPQNGLKQVPT